MSFTNAQSQSQSMVLFGRGGYNAPANTQTTSASMGQPLDFGRGGYNRGDDDEEEDGRGGYN